MSTHLKWGEIHPRTMLADLALHPGAGAWMQGEVGQHRPWMDLAPLEVGRHPGGALKIRAVASVGIVAQLALEEVAPAPVRGRLPSSRQTQACGDRCVVERVVLQRSHPVDGARRLQWRAPAVIAPGSGVGREHLVVIAGLVDDPTRFHGIRRPGAHQGYAMARKLSLDIEVARHGISLVRTGSPYAVAPG